MDRRALLKGLLATTAIAAPPALRAGAATRNITATEILAREAQLSWPAYGVSPAMLCLPSLQELEAILAPYLAGDRFGFGR